jgi:hypothetical protein
MELKEVIARLREMRDRNYNFPERDALTIAIVYLEEDLKGHFPPDLPIELTHTKLGDSHE